HWPHQTAIGAGIADLDRDHDLLAGHARHLHGIARAEAAVGHLHHPRLCVRGGGARLLPGFTVALFFALRALPLDLREPRLPRAADAIAAGIEPQRQQKPRRRRRMTGPVDPSLDLTLELAQVEPFYIGPDHPHRVVFPDQALDIHRLQLDLVAPGLAQARSSARDRIGSRPRPLR